MGIEVRVVDKRHPMCDGKTRRVVEVDVNGVCLVLTIAGALRLQELLHRALAAKQEAS